MSKDFKSLFIFYHKNKLIKMFNHILKRIKQELYSKSPFDLLQFMIFFELIFQIKQESRPGNWSKRKISGLVKTACMWGKQHWFGWREQKVGRFIKCLRGPVGNGTGPGPGTEPRHSEAPGPSVSLLFLVLAKCLSFSSFSGGRMSLSHNLSIYLFTYFFT